MSGNRADGPSAGERAPVLLTVSGVVPADLDRAIAAGERPRADYRVMQDRFGADLVDVSAASAECGRWGRLLHRVGGPGLLLAWYCFRHRRRYRVIVTDGEQVGIPLALLCRVFGRGGSRQVMIVHIVSTRAKSAIVRGLRLAPIIDRWVVYCSWQRDFVETELDVDAGRILLTPFMVDTEFFRPDAVGADRRRMICAVGLERRDYPTLMRAVEGLDVEVVIAAASPWSTQSDSTGGQSVPSNVTIRSYTQAELRVLYAQARFTVMPLVEVEFQAGITAILESMAMGRAVVCTRTPGQTDTILDGVTGVYVPPGDEVALRHAIEALLADDDRARRLGSAARGWAVAHAEVERYAAGIASVVDDLRR